MVFFGWKWVSSNLSVGCYHSRPPKLKCMRPKTSGSFSSFEMILGFSRLHEIPRQLGCGFGGMDFGFLILEFGLF